MKMNSLSLKFMSRLKITKKKMKKMTVQIKRSLNQNS